MLRQACRLATRCSRSGCAAHACVSPLELASSSGPAWEHASAGHAVVGALLGGSQPRHHSTDSIASSVEELNQELVSYFGGAAPDLDSSSGPRSPSPGASATPMLHPGRGAAAASPDLARQAAALNEELLEFFGGQHLQAAKAPAAPVATAPQQQDLQAASSSSSSSTQAASSSSDNGRGGSAQPPHLTHVDATGRASMVDVSEKLDSVRSATATARVLLGPEVFALVAGNQLKKGDVLTVAQLAGVIGAKYTSHLIPLCHNILLSKVQVDLALAPEAHAVDITALARTVGPTGVEMEALTAAAVSALTVYDMVKAASKDVVITDVRLQAKSGGRSGDYVRGGTASSGA